MFFSHLVVSMKKYLFLISLLTVVFLWLGNYSFGQWETCTCTTDWSWNVQSINCPSWRQQSWNWCNCRPEGWSEILQCTNTNNSTPAGWIGWAGGGAWWATTVTCSSIKTWSDCKYDNWCKWQDNMCKSCKAPGVCCGISLNTSVPFIGNCIENSTGNVGAGETDVTWDTAFPVLMWSLTKILVTIILIVSFVLIIIWGIMIATGNPGGKKMIIRVVVGIALLGASGVILRLINPNFFG